MEELKDTVASNIISLRKSFDLTQAELAEVLNYSDKAVSKWERAESVPDIAVLKKISDFFDVSLDYLVEKEHKTVKKKDSRHQRLNRLIITLLSASLVWFVATTVFAVLDIIKVESSVGLWMVYVYAVPATCVVLIVFNALWGKRKYTFIVVSVLVWSIIASVYVAFLSYNLWQIFIIGIPAQLIIILWANLKA